MAGYVESAKREFPVGAAMSAYLRVKASAGLLVLAGADDSDLGTIEVTTAASEFGQSFWPVTAAVRLASAQGTAKMVASGAISAFADIYADANGKVTATPGPKYIGKAIDAATANNDVIEVLRMKGAGGVVNGAYTAVNGDGVADGTTIVTGLSLLTGAIVQIRRAGAVVTADAVITINSVTNGNLKVANGGATYVMATGDVIDYIAYGS